MFRKVILMYVLLLGVVAVKAQKKSYSKDSSLILLTKHTNKEILLRWIPAGPTIWREGNIAGYRIIRYTIERNGKKIIPAEFKVLVNNPLKPQPDAFWQKLALSEKNADLANDALYKIDEPTKENKETPQEIENYHFVFGMFAANSSMKVAQGMALGYSDVTVKTNEEYRYEVVLTSLSGKTYKAVSINGLGMRQFEKAVESLKISYLDSIATIQFTNKPQFMAINIERSDDGGATFKKVNETPIVPTYDENNPKSNHTEVATRIEKLYQKYKFRIRGITPFGDEGIPSEEVEIFAYNTNIPPPQNLQHLGVNTGGTLLTWDYPDSLLINLKGFKVGFNQSVADTAIHYLANKLLPVTSRKFLDKKPQNQGFYRVVAIDLQDRVLISNPLYAQIIDSIAPEKPKKIQGKIDKKGIASISWAPNTEDDLYGYRLFRSDNLKVGFHNISKEIKKDTAVKDTVALKILDKYVYYLVIAFDNHLNASLSSDTLKLKRPDIIPPIAPIIQKFLVTDTTITFSWINSSSEDVAKHRILRRALPDTTLQLLYEFTPQKPITVFADTTVKEGHKYYYQLEAIDDSELSSGNACKITLEIEPPHYRKPITEVKAKYRGKEEGIEIIWEYEKPPHPVKSFTLFRKEDRDTFRYYKTLKNTETSFHDLAIQSEKSYTYALVAFLEDGSETIQQASNIVEVPKKFDKK